MFELADDVVWCIEVHPEWVDDIIGQCRLLVISSVIFDAKDWHLSGMFVIFPGMLYVADLVICGFVR